MDFASLEPLEGGWSGETFVARVGAGERQVVRIHARNPERAEVDAALLRLVRGLVPVPEVVDVRRAADGLPALLVTTYLPGERGDLVLPRLGGADLAVLGGQVGELVATLGGMPQPRPGEFVGADLLLRPWEGAADLEEFAAHALATTLQRWPAAERAGLAEVAEVAGELLSTVDRTCLVHSDLNPKNLLVDPDSLAITGLVDWEYAHAGHPFTDLGNALRFEREPAYVDAVLASLRAAARRAPRAGPGARTRRRPVRADRPRRTSGGEPGRGPGRATAARHRALGRPGCRGNLLTQLGVGQGVTGLLESMAASGGAMEHADDDAFARLFFAHAARLVRLAGFLGAADAEDVVQEAYCRVFAARRRVRAEEGEVVRYLTRSVVNEVRDRHRRSQVARAKAHLVVVDPVVASSDGAERLGVRAAVAALPDRQREAIVLRFWLDLPYEDVARAMGVRTGTAKSQVSRALVALREWTDEWADEPDNDSEETP